MVRILNSFRDAEKERAIKYKDISSWLVTNSYITETINDDGRIHRESTQKGNQAGIFSEQRTKADGKTYNVLLCKYGGQRLIVTHYFEIIGMVQEEADSIVERKTNSLHEYVLTHVEQEKLLQELKTDIEVSEVSCKKCMLYRNDTCFGQKRICEDFRNAVDISEHEREQWPDRMQGPYGTLHREIKR